MCLAICQQLALIIKGMVFHLIREDGIRSDRPGLIQPGYREITHPHSPDFPRLDQRLQPGDGFLQGHGIVRPMDQVEVDVLHTQSPEAVFTSDLDGLLSKMVTPRLCGQKNVLPVHARFHNRPPDLLFIVIKLRGVNMPVAHIKGTEHTPLAARTAHLPGPQTDFGDSLPEHFYILHHDHKNPPAQQILYFLMIHSSSSFGKRVGMSSRILGLKVPLPRVPTIVASSLQRTFAARNKNLTRTGRPPNLMVGQALET